MRIVSYDLAKATLLFSLEEAAPLGGVNTANIILGIADRYHFAKHPDLKTPREELGKIGLKFEDGFFVGSQINVSEFNIFSDGIVVSAKTTDDAEYFIADILQFMRENHNFREFIEAPLTRFISQIVVEFSSKLASLIKDHNLIANLISSQLSSIYQESISLDFSRLDFEFDKIGTKSPLIVPRFVIERRPGVAFERERYYCFAPLRTRDHIRVLEEIENSIT